MEVLPEIPDILVVSFSVRRCALRGTLVVGKVVLTLNAGEYVRAVRASVYRCDHKEKIMQYLMFELTTVNDSWARFPLSQLIGVVYNKML